MAITIDEFNRDLFQEILAEADADGRFVEDVFFEKFCEYLTDAGELDTADRADYRGRAGSGIRVDGYGGDPIDSSGTLSLIIADFNQSHEVGRLTGTEMNAIFQRLYRFLQKTLEPTWRNALEETSRAFGLADLIAQRWNGINRVRLILISNRELSERVDGREADEFDGRTITYSVWDIKRLHRFATIGHGKEDIEINLKEDFGVALPVLPAHLSAENYESYLVVVPGRILAGIYDRWGARLLEQNVRVFLQARGNVNKGIRNTLQNEPEMFFAYNNGITATAEAVFTEEQQPAAKNAQRQNVDRQNAPRQGRHPARFRPVSRFSARQGVRLLCGPLGHGAPGEKKSGPPVTVPDAVKGFDFGEILIHGLEFPFQISHFSPSRCEF